MSDEQAECPLCMEALEIDDHSFFPCTCGYQICRFCWHRIRTDENGLCPACRKQYPEDPAEFKPLSEDELQNIKKERKQKDVQRKQKAAENRKHLANVRVVQRNLVFVVGLSPRLADPEVLKKHEYFGKFGKIHKVVINQSTSYAGTQGPSASAYVTYVKPEDALRAILTVNNVHVEGRTLKTSLGTTKYCSHFLKGSHCQKSDCMYLHEMGEEAASFTKDEMQAGKHQEYEQMLIEQFLNAQNSANNHHIANNKIKKPVSPQSIENSEVIPSLMDISSDIKLTLPNTGPLLPNPAQNGASSHTQPTSSSSSWPVIDGSGSPAPGTSSKTELSSNSNNRAQGHRNQAQQTASTPPGSGGASCVSHLCGTQRQRSSNSLASSTDESLISSQINPVTSNRATSLTPPGDREKGSISPQSDQPASRGLPIPTQLASPSQQASSKAGSVASVPASTPSLPTPTVNAAVNGTQTQTQKLQHADQCSMNGMVGAIGSNRRPGSSETDSIQGLSFFGTNLLNNSHTSGPVQPATTVSSTEMPSVSLPHQEMADSLPVSTSTDWSAAFGFDNKELPPEDDLGFDPCAESFKGLADLIEKENGMQQQQQQLHLSQRLQSRLGSPPQQMGFPSHTLLHSQHQNSTQYLQTLPPGFSLSQIQQQQQQQQQHFFRPASSKMLELLPQFAPATHQRFPQQPNYHSLQMDLHVQHQPQRDLFTMKDMQEQLRSMLPNINISFGDTYPRQIQQHQVPLHPSQQTQHINKSWQLSSSPESSPWNDPAIVSTSHFTDSPVNMFPETAPHWLKSLHQLTETEGPSHRLPFVQQFPLAGAGGWPPHTHNPPPGFRTGGLANPQTTDAHKLTEVRQ